MSTSARGYGSAHQRRRAQLLNTCGYGHICALCHQPMTYPQPLDLDHSHPLARNPHAVGDRIVHASCNRSAGAKGGGHPTTATQGQLTDPATSTRTDSGVRI